MIRYLILALTGLVAVSTADIHARQPNVVMIAVDDMCDWIGPMGHAQAVTPNMDRLAAAGVTFQNAHTAGIFCAPSRSAIFSGRHASTTGCYTTQVYFHNHPEITPLQKTLQNGGYATYGAGKLFHHPAGFVDLRGWSEFFLRDARLKKRGWDLETWSTDSPILPQPYPNSAFNHDRKPANNFFLEWGKVLNKNEEKMADTIRTQWACDLIRKKHDKPFFVAVGLYTPHFPNYAPAKYFDLYDRDKIKLPPYLDGDLNDLPPAVRKAKTARGAIHRRLEKLDAVKDAIHGYLACISYADAMLGRVLDAIESGPNADNTIIVLWSDHGYHHGEKQDWGKHTLWERTSNVPFIWAGPGIERGASIDATVSLIDMFPTLMDMCKLPKDEGLDGVSLAGALKSPSEAKDRNTLLPGMKPGEYAIMNRDWRYIHYASGGEELYDIRRDPNEWKNLANNAKCAKVKKQLKASAPPSFAEPGTSVRELKLITEGESFQWVSKQKTAAKPLPKSVSGARMVPLKSSPESQVEPVDLAGRSAWKSALRSGKPTYFYFQLKDPSYRNGNQPNVQVSVTYLDLGKTAVAVEYDSSDMKVNASHPKGAGVFKKATRFQVNQSGKWRTVIFNLEDARFAGRCNDGDLRLGFIRPDADPVIAEVFVQPRQTMHGKVYCGYQGWFSGKNDGTGIDFDNYRFDGVFKPGCCVIDLWPDMSEMDQDEKYATPFLHSDGSEATVFSSANAKTVDRHFSWMKTYGIDGVFLQRFGWALTDPPTLRHRNVVIDRVRKSAAKHDREWAVMYDLTSLTPGQIRKFVMADWKKIIESGDPRPESSYIRHNGKPVVAIWGVGFRHNRAYSLEECLELIRFLKNDPVCGGNAVMLGVPYYWREQERDASQDATLHKVLLEADILSPWTIGRYRSPDEMDKHQKSMAADQEWLKERGKSYLPVAFPGFSWQNLEKCHGREAKLDAIPRRGGQFLWAQALATQRAGSHMLYVAMFDEMNEATAIFKCTNNPPVGKSAFMTYDKLPSDHYLWLTGQIGKLLRREIEPTRELPTRQPRNQEK